MTMPLMLVALLLWHLEVDGPTESRCSAEAWSDLFLQYNVGIAETEAESWGALR